jgi:predicted aspartyl protease
MQIQLVVYRDPGQVEVFLNIKRKDGGYFKRAALVDTGAQVTLLPKLFMDILDYRLGGNKTLIIEQAGVAKQSFEAIEAFVTLSLEDMNGNHTEDIETRVWFAETRYILLGFDGVLDRAVLHLDVPNLTGYLEFAKG